MESFVVCWCLLVIKRLLGRKKTKDRSATAFVGSGREASVHGVEARARLSIKTLPLARPARHLPTHRRAMAVPLGAAPLSSATRWPCCDPRRHPAGAARRPTSTTLGVLGVLGGSW